MLTSLVENALSALPPGDTGPIDVVAAVTARREGARELVIDVSPAEPDRCTAREAESKGAVVSWFPGHQNAPTTRAVLSNPASARTIFHHFDQGPPDA